MTVPDFEWNVKSAECTKAIEKAVCLLTTDLFLVPDKTDIHYVVNYDCIKYYAHIVKRGGRPKKFYSYAIFFSRFFNGFFLDIL